MKGKSSPRKIKVTQKKKPKSKKPGPDVKPDIKPEKKLTEKERLFCSFYVTYRNATRAAREAGYSAKTANVIGYENLMKPYLKQEIKRLSENLEAHMAEIGITKERNLAEAAKIAYNGIASLHNTWIERKEFEALTDDQRACIQEIDTKVLKRNIGTDEEPDIVDVECIKIKLFSKTEALKLINDMMGWNAPTKSEIDLNSKQKDMAKNFDDLFANDTEK